MKSRDEQEFQGVLPKLNRDPRLPKMYSPKIDLAADGIGSMLRAKVNHNTTKIPGELSFDDALAVFDRLHTIFKFAGAFCLRELDLILIEDKQQKFHIYYYKSGIFTFTTLGFQKDHGFIWAFVNEILPYLQEYYLSWYYNGKSGTVIPQSKQGLMPYFLSDAPALAPAASVFNPNEFSQAMHDYLQTFAGSVHLSKQVEFLHLTDAEEDLFKDYEDIETHVVMDIPVSVNGTYYDIKSVLRFKKEGDQYIQPITGYKFHKIEIQQAHKIADQIRALINSIKKSRPEVVQAEVLAQFWQPSRRIENYEHFKAEITEYLQKKYGLDKVYRTILADCLIRMADESSLFDDTEAPIISDDPNGYTFRSCINGDNSLDPDIILLSMIGYNGRSEHVLRLVNLLQNKYGNELCEYASGFDRFGVQQGSRGIYRIKFNKSKLIQILPEIIATLDSILDYSRALAAYQIKSDNPEIYKIAIEKLSSLAKAEQLSIEKTDILEIVFARMFGCNAPITSATFMKGEGYLAEYIDVNFYLNISEEQAIALVNVINAKFPAYESQSCYLGSQHYVGKITHCKISIDVRILNSDAFRSEFQRTLQALINEEGMLIAELRNLSKPDNKDLGEFLGRLEKMSDKFKDKNYYGKDFAAKISKFSLIFSDHRSNPAEKAQANEELNQAARILKAFMPNEERIAFKQEEGFQIKSFQHRLGLSKK